ncbi:MAG: ABC transporter substrate-binding protein [Bacteroidetes bacterium]|nr:ABC transporter substrate-binding protein [Bacteroidota bacterium]
MNAKKHKVMSQSDTLCELLTTRLFTQKKLCSYVVKIFTLFSLFFFSCKNPETKTDFNFSDFKRDTSIRYAKRFAIARNADIALVYLFGNKTNFDTTSVFLLYKDTTLVQKNLPKKITAVKIPCTKIAALSSIYANMLNDLGMLENLAAIDNMDYIINPDIIKKFEAKQLLELQKSPNIELEQTIALQPDIIFSFGMGNPEKDIEPKLAQTKIPVAMSVDHLEENPLARAEWIKFFAAFVDKYFQADSIFKATEKNYLELKTLASQAQTQPTVFSEIKYGDVWYLPGGKSYMAQLLNDASANYIWKNDSSAGSLPLSFEQVYVKAKNADFWLNQAMIKTKQELLDYESRYSEFAAFKKGNLYNNIKTTNNKGYSTYWETGMIYPDRILSDFIFIFHPELKSRLKNDLYYYKQLN